MDCTYCSRTTDGWEVEAYCDGSTYREACDTRWRVRTYRIMPLVLSFVHRISLTRQKLVLFALIIPYAMTIQVSKAETAFMWPITFLSVAVCTAKPICQWRMTIIIVLSDNHEYAQDAAEWGSRW